MTASPLALTGTLCSVKSRTTLRMWWAETTWQMQRLRDNPACADEEHKRQGE
ncbi:hypothetical protein [Cedecea neteri]|uniref:hypothetical protein n=1 Tax=Cedecea neteri TaxID=158822 RepID=UPI003AFB669E